MELLKIAEDSGLEVIVGGRIGREEYSSVHGSIAALDRFVVAILMHATTQPVPNDPLVENPSCDYSV
ncbi:hypothetical protein [Paraburkholderia sacchari]|uniref:hypothetical protein n=1 Tax=Paraburkholderia sacchari TaxID=159450 RepID=UPI003D9602BB